MRKKRGNIRAAINYMGSPGRETSLRNLSEWFRVETVTDEKVYTSADLAGLFQAITETPGAATPRESG